MTGRQAGQVVLSPQARTFLEGQVRRHKAPRSLSDRCQMVLLYAEGLQSKEVAARLGYMRTPSANGGGGLSKMASKA